MKAIIYKNPVIAAIFINFISSILFIYTIKERRITFIMPLVIVGIVNRQILDNGSNINRKKKIIIYISFFLMLVIGLIFNYYMYKVVENQIINS